MNPRASSLHRLRRVDWAISLVASLGLAYLLLLDSPSSGWLDRGMGSLALVIAAICVGALVRPARDEEPAQRPAELWDVIGPLFFPAQLAFHGSDRGWPFGLAGALTLLAAVLVQIAIWRARRAYVGESSNA